MAIDWISVNERVPDDRRNVLAFGVRGLQMMFGYQPLKNEFIGVTRYNATKDGGMFDCEKPARFSFCRVTHWAEIDGPKE